MTISQVSASGLLRVVAFVLVSASFGVTQTAVPATRNVTIDNNNCDTNQPTLIISVQDQASWTANDQTYTLRFTTSPFTGIASGVPISVLRGQTKASGGVTVQVKNQCANNNDDANPSCRFKYSVTGSAAHACTKDPVVIIKH